MKLGLILCAFGRHAWFCYCCRSKDAPRDTQRECRRCDIVQTRLDSGTPWKAAK